MKSGALGGLSDPAAKIWQERVIRARKSIHVLLFVSAAPFRGRRSRFICHPRPLAPLTTFITASILRESSLPLLFSLQSLPTAPAFYVVSTCTQTISTFRLSMRSLQTAAPSATSCWLLLLSILVTLLSSELLLLSSFNSQRIPTLGHTASNGLKHKCLSLAFLFFLLLIYYWMGEDGQFRFQVCDIKPKLQILPPLSSGFSKVCLLQNVCFGCCWKHQKQFPFISLQDNFAPLHIHMRKKCFWVFV